MQLRDTQRRGEQIPWLVRSSYWYEGMSTLQYQRIISSDEGAPHIVRDVEPENTWVLAMSNGGLATAHCKQRTSC